jgi:hypothetical protein
VLNEPKEGREPLGGRHPDPNHSDNAAETRDEWLEKSRPDLARDLTAERYKYILQQIHVVNEISTDFWLYAKGS